MIDNINPILVGDRRLPESGDTWKSQREGRDFASRAQEGGPSGQREQLLLRHTDVGVTLWEGM